MKISDQSISLTDYTYELPESKIAKHPLPDRSASKLLAYNKGKITHENFSDIGDHISADTTLFFNDTKVIPARLYFKKETGALIEVFLLEPVSPTNDVAKAMLVKDSCQWHCMIGNLKKWKDGQVLELQMDIDDQAVVIQAQIANREKQIIELSWDGDMPFVDVVTAAGKIPLPPYIDRELDENDKNRYQTVYSNHEGAVAAPTAGLHFTEEVIGQLRSNSVKINYLTLHVSAGTFQPVKVENAIDHTMHSEQVVVSLDNINAVIESEKIVAVGTTSMRTLESLYWYGVKLIKTDNPEFNIPKLFPYQFEDQELPDLKESFLAIKRHMSNLDLKIITGFTEIFIFPGYTFKVCNGLVTNFHLPGSTLILLVAAFVGEDWKTIYNEALQNGYRFLSYGDSSVLLP